MLGASEGDTQGYITRSSSLSASLITDSQCSGVPWSTPTSQLPHTPRRHDELMVTSNSLMMVGYGVNDAPVLAVSDVGMAMDAKGSTAASESADIVIMVDNLGVVPRALEIGQTTIGIAWQSIWLGTIISVGLMALSVLGFCRRYWGHFCKKWWTSLPSWEPSVRGERSERGGSALLSW